MIRSGSLASPSRNDYSQLSNISEIRGRKGRLDNACVQNIMEGLLWLLQISSICHVVMHGRCRISEKGRIIGPVRGKD